MCEFHGWSESVKLGTLGMETACWGKVPGPNYTFTTRRPHAFRGRKANGSCLGLAQAPTKRGMQRGNMAQGKYSRHQDLESGMQCSHSSLCRERSRWNCPDLGKHLVPCLTQTHYRGLWGWPGDRLTKEKVRKGKARKLCRSFLRSFQRPWAGSDKRSNWMGPSRTRNLILLFYRSGN